MEYLILFTAAIVVTILAVASTRRRKEKGRSYGGALSGALGVADEIFRPAAYEAQIVQEAETRMPAPAPLAGDPGPGGDGLAGDGD